MLFLRFYRPETSFKLCYLCYAIFDKTQFEYLTDNCHTFKIPFFTDIYFKYIYFFLLCYCTFHYFLLKIKLKISDNCIKKVYKTQDLCTSS